MNYPVFEGLFLVFIKGFVDWLMIKLGWNPMKASEEALIRYLKFSRNFGDFLISIMLVGVDGILDSDFNFMSRFNHVGWFN